MVSCIRSAALVISKHGKEREAKNREPDSEGH